MCVCMCVCVQGDAASDGSHPGKMRQHASGIGCVLLWARRRRLPSTTMRHAGGDRRAPPCRRRLPSTTMQAETAKHHHAPECSCLTRCLPSPPN